MHGARKLYGPQLRMVAGVKSLNVPVSIVDLDFTPELGPGRDGGEGIKWNCWKHMARGGGWCAHFAAYIPCSVIVRRGDVCSAAPYISYFIHLVRIPRTPD